MIEKVLYKKDSKGKLRIFKICTKGDNLIQESGLIDGKLVLHSKVCTPKNVGKSNETTGKEQAISELESEWKQKQDEGYFETLLEANTEEVILPMLAKSYNDEKHKIDWSAENVYIQPKLDGMRCLAHITDGCAVLVSRDGKFINGLDHIRKDLSTIAGNVILDGELYAHGLNFQENMRLIKKYRPGETEQIKYHVYDLISNQPFFKRKVRGFIKDLDTCVEVSTYEISNEIQLSNFHTLFLKEGYEGSIIRHGVEGYKKNGRSSNLLKYKDFKDIDVKIINIVPADQRPSWGVPVLEYNGKTFQAGMKFSHKEREEWLKNKKKYIGETAIIRFFEWTEDGLPRFPVCIGTRLDNKL